MKAAVWAIGTFMVGIVLGLSLGGMSGRAYAQAKQISSDRDRRAICLDPVEKMESGGYTTYGLRESCRVIAHLPESMISDRDLAQLETMARKVTDITAITNTGNGVDIKLDAMVRASADEFRKNRVSFCARHPELSVFDLNEANDELPPHSCSWAVQ